MLCMSSLNSNLNTKSIVTQKWQLSSGCNCSTENSVAYSILVWEYTDCRAVPAIHWCTYVSDNIVWNWQTYECVRSTYTHCPGRAQFPLAHPVAQIAVITKQITVTPTAIIVNMHLWHAGKKKHSIYTQLSLHLWGSCCLGLSNHCDSSWCHQNYRCSDLHCHLSVCSIRYKKQCSSTGCRRVGTALQCLLHHRYPVQWWCLSRYRWVTSIG